MQSQRPISLQPVLSRHTAKFDNERGNCRSAFERHRGRANGEEAVKEILAFICDFCPRKKRFAVRATAVKHESRCFYNPATRACATCGNFNYVPDYHEIDTGYSEGGPECAKGMLGTSTEESPLRSKCEGWEPKTSSIVPIKSIRFANVAGDAQGEGRK
jgi:hypothetical protein